MSDCERTAEELGGLVSGKMTDRPRRRTSCVRARARARRLSKAALPVRDRAGERANAAGYEMAIAIGIFEFRNRAGQTWKLLAARSLARSRITADSDSEQTTCDKWRPNQDLVAAGRAGAAERQREAGRQAGRQDGRQEGRWE